MVPHTTLSSMRLDRCTARVTGSMAANETMVAVPPKARAVEKTRPDMPLGNAGITRQT